MNFKPYLIEKIKTGQKTQTRRIQKDGDLFVDYKVNPGYIEDKNRRIKWQVGKTYAICPGRGKKAEGYIRVTRLRSATLGNITTEDAIAEGFASIDEFNQALTQIYGECKSVTPVWVIDFKYIGETK